MRSISLQKLFGCLDYLLAIYILISNAQLVAFVEPQSFEVNKKSGDLEYLSL